MQACSVLVVAWANTHLNVIIIEMKKVRYREVKGLAQGQKASK